MSRDKLKRLLPWAIVAVLGASVILAYRYGYEVGKRRGESDAGYEIGTANRTRFAGGDLRINYK